MRRDRVSPVAREPGGGIDGCASECAAGRAAASASRADPGDPGRTPRLRRPAGRSSVRSSSSSAACGPGPASTSPGSRARCRLRRQPIAGARHPPVPRRRGRPSSRRRRHSASRAGGAAGSSTRSSSGASPTATATGSATCAALTARLDQLNDGDPRRRPTSGSPGMWLMPIMRVAAYHGYDVSRLRAPSSADYGTAADLKASSRAAQPRGIAVIVRPRRSTTPRATIPGSSTVRTTGLGPRRLVRLGPATAAGRPGLAPDGRPLVLRPVRGGPAGPQPAQPGGHRRDRPTSPASGCAESASTASGSTRSSTSSRTDRPRRTRRRPTPGSATSGRRSTQTAPDALLARRGLRPVPVRSRATCPRSVDLAFDFGLAQATIDSLRRGDAGLR